MDAEKLIIVKCCLLNKQTKILETKKKVSKFAEAKI